MHFINIINKNYLIVFIFLSIILHLISSYYSVGFYSDDEHFQILEISAYLLGINEIAINDPTGYYWEWEENTRMRPWFQPFIFYKIINVLILLGLNDPFIWVFILRFISSILGFVSILYLFFTFKDHFFKQNKIFNYFLFFTFWFYPFLHSRTSSENLSISLFLISFCILFQILIDKKIKYNFFIFVIASFLMGISMVAKFTTVFHALPFFLWIFLFKFNYKILFNFSFCIFIALFLGLYIDYINWGSFKNTYYQFYHHNLSGVTGAMKTFGVDPWYYYLIEIIKQLAPMLSLFFLSGLILFWYKNLKNVLTWVTLIAFIIFSLIGHKEIRYIFPIYIFAPFFIAYFLSFIKYKKILILIKYIIILSNLIFLIITIFFAANAKVGIYNFLNKNKIENTPIYYIGENPYQVNNMEPFFYTKFLPEINKFNKDKINNNNFIILTNNYESFKDQIKLECLLLYSTYPIKIINYNKNWKRLKLNWRIYNCYN